MFEIPAALLSWFYGFTNGYTTAIALIAVVVMAITTPLTLKSTKGMLEMQKLAPEMRKLQNEYRNDRTKLNEEMMKLYQEHKVNPMASCLPMVAQMPVFIIMFRVLRGLTYSPRGAALPVSQAVWGAFGRPEEVADPGFIPRYLSVDSALYTSLFGEHEMPSLGLDLSKSAVEAVADGFGTGIWYVLLVVFLGVMYFVQQRMVAARAAVSPSMSPSQQKLMQYLPVFFAIFQIFFLAALVVYYIFQTLLRILQQVYITRTFYGHDEALGRQAQRAGAAARDEAEKSGESTGMFSQAKRDLAAASKPKEKPTPKSGKKAPPEAEPKRATTSKRVTPPKNRPTPSSGAKGRPTPTRSEAKAAKTSKKSSKSSRPNSSDSKSSKKKT
ncbi:MAG: YidC/Oxa1 family membrane protein insertase [Ilumatobacteraceae bacterium]